VSAAAPSRPDFLESEPFVVELERFQGPLDLLLHLIRSQDIDIFDIPIARITQQFQAALEAGLERLELDRAGEFVEMASTLIRIKARLLLPRPGEPDWEDDPRSELVRRLLEYEHFHEVAQLLSSREAERARHFGKGFVEPRPTPEARHTELETGRDELLEAARQVPEPPEEIVHEAPVRRVTVEQKISLLGRLVRSVKRLAFEKLFQPWGTRSHAVASFLACLEMARRQVVRLEQVERFGSIWIFPCPGGEAMGDEAPEPASGMSAGGEPAGNGAPEERAPDAPEREAAP
jgi:segregation and condensation protein A